MQVNKRIVKNMKTINFSDRTSNREKLIINQFITVKAVILFHLLSFGCLPNEFEIDDRGAHSITGSRCEGAGMAESDTSSWVYSLRNIFTFFDKYIFRNCHENIYVLKKIKYIFPIISCSRTGEKKTISSLS